MNNYKTQQGNTFYGLLIGIVLAALIIASILWYLNNNKTSFQTYVPPEPIPKIPENLPHLQNGQDPEINRTDTILKDFSIDPIIIDQALIDPVTVEQISIIPPKDDIEALITTFKTQQNPKNETVINSNNTLANTHAQRTPEQILNAKTTQAIKNNNSKFVVQMGSFSNPEQAERRKAELSLLNINATIQQSEKNGQIVYRVRSTSLNQEDANKLKNTLKNKQIDNIIIPLN